MSTPVIHLLAGPNGAGKTTLVTRVIQPRTHLRFVNADVIAHNSWPGEELEHAYEAPQLAAAVRAELLAERRSLITETVFSHPSKVALVHQAVAAGYLVNVHVVMVPMDVSVGRVNHRLRHDGHDVPEQKIRERWERLWPLLFDARRMADRTVFYDNSAADTPYCVCAVYERGQLVSKPSWPIWAPDVIATQD